MLVYVYNVCCSFQNILGINDIAHSNEVTAVVREYIHVHTCTYKCTMS